MKRPLLLDGAMGTALLEAGLPDGALPERWLTEAPERIAAVHAAHAAAGAELLLSCSFNLAGPRLDAAALTATVEQLAVAAVRVARAAAPGRRVAGATGPALAPGGDAAEAYERHERAFRALERAGADLLWAESHWDLAEARAALAAARGCGLPVVVTFAFGARGDGLASAGGEPALACLEAVARDGAAAVGVNCALPGAALVPLLAAAARELTVPIVAKPSAGLPGRLLAPDEFAAWLEALVVAGAAWAGGCCGATAAHLAACRRRLAARASER